MRQNTDVAPDAVPADEAFYVYHRDGLPCRVCGTPVLLKGARGAQPLLVRRLPDVTAGAPGTRVHPPRQNTQLHTGATGQPKAALARERVGECSVTRPAAPRAASDVPPR